MKCFDTDFLVFLLRGDEAVKRQVNELDQEHALSVSAITAFELLYGAKRSGRVQENVKEVLNLLNGLVLLPFDLEAAEKASSIQAALASKGKMVPISDLFIAAIAVANGCELVTLNKKHFSGIPGLKAE